MNRDFENEFGQEDERLRGRSRRRDAGVGSTDGGAAGNIGYQRSRDSGGVRENRRPASGNSRQAAPGTAGRPPLEGQGNRYSSTRGGEPPLSGGRFTPERSGSRTPPGVRLTSEGAGGRNMAGSGTPSGVRLTSVSEGSGSRGTTAGARPVSSEYTGRATTGKRYTPEGQGSRQPVNKSGEPGLTGGRFSTDGINGRRTAGPRTTAGEYGTLPLSGSRYSGDSQRSRAASGSRFSSEEIGGIGISGSRRSIKETAATIPVQREVNRTRRLIIFMIIAEIIILCGIWATRNFLQKYNMIQRDTSFNMETMTNPNLNVDKVKRMKGYWTVALFGVDSRNNSVGKGNNADVIIICNINQDTGEIKLVSVFRDSYLNVDDDGSYNKINQAYFRGGPKQAVEALNKNLDLQIDDYATFNWKAVADAINILGGVDVELSKAEFYYINAFITETVEATGIASKHLKSAGPNHLDGVQAVAYARLRKMDTDFARTERQRKIIELSFQKLKQADFSVVNNVMEVVFPQILTSVTLDDVIPSARNLTRFTIADTAGFPSARSDANMGKKGDCVIPQTLESNVVLLHQFLFGEENYEPSDMVKKISAKISADSGMYNTGKPVDRVGTDGGYIPKPTEATKSNKDEETKESKKNESESSSTDTDESIIDGEFESDLETDEFGNELDPPESDGTTDHPGIFRPGETTSTYPYSPGESSSWSGSGRYPGESSPTRDEVTGPGATQGVNPGNTSTSAAYPGGTTASESYPGSTKATSPPYPNSTSEEYVPEGPGSVIIGPGQ